MAGSKKPNQNRKNNEDNSLFIGIGVGAIFLVLAELFFIMAEIYYMLMGAGSLIVLIISAVLLLGTTGVFIYILKNVVIKKFDEQKLMYEELLQINKATYMRMKRISDPAGEGATDEVASFREIVDEICKDIAYMQRKQSEEIYKRQMSIANVQIKRIHENVAAMLDFNEQIRKEIEEKLNEMSEIDSYGEAIMELQGSVQELYDLCESIAEAQENAPVPAVETMTAPEPEVEEAEAEIEESEPELEAEVEELEPESEVEEPEVEPEPESAPVLEVSGDSNRQLTAEEIAAMFNNV